MWTRRDVVIGISAALAITACGIVASNSSGTPGGHPAPVSARHAPAATPVTDQEALARIKRRLMRPAWDRVVPRPRGDMSSFAYRDLAEIKRDIAVRAVQQARSR